MVIHLYIYLFMVLCNDKKGKAIPVTGCGGP
jgi:hypothetical protein